MSSADDQPPADEATADAAQPPEPSQEEVERLQREVAELRAQLPPSQPTRASRGRRRSGGARWTGVVVLALLVGLLTPVALLARYARSELLDTDRYVATVAPLARDPAVQEQVADDVTREVFSHLDIERVTRETLQSLADAGAPSAVVDLATPIADQVQSFARDEVRTLVGSEQFATLWAEANRVAHDELDLLLTGDEEGAVQADDGKVTLDLGPVVAAVRERLVDRGFGLASNIPDVSTELTLVESPDLARAQTAVRLLDTAATVLPFVVLALVVAAVWLAPNRRRGLFAAALAVVLGAVLLGVALAVVRSWYLPNLTSDELSPEAATSIADILLRPLRSSLRAVLVVGLVAAVAAYLAGPSAPAVVVRRGVTRAFAATRNRAASGRTPSPVEAWVGAHKSVLRVGIVATAALALAFWTYPTGGVVLVLLGLVLVALAMVEVLGATPGPVPTVGPAAGTSVGKSA